MTHGTTPPDDTHPGLRAAAGRAILLVTNGSKVGLGSGRAASAFIDQLGARVRQGLSAVGVPTSDVSARQARTLGIPLIELDEGVELDLTVDGADEVAPNLDMIKGRGGALVKERIVAAASRRQVILVGSEKLVRALGERGGIPIEVIPLARGLVAQHVKALGLHATLRCRPTDGGALITDNGNLTLDCTLAAPIIDRGAAQTLHRALRDIPGVVDTGLFLQMAERVLVGYPDGRVDVLSRTNDAPKT